MAGIDEALDWWITQVESVSGIVAAGLPTDKMGASGLIFMAYEASGTCESQSASMIKDLVTLRGLLMAPRADMRNSIMATRGKARAIAHLVLADTTMGANVQTTGNPTYAELSQDWQALGFFGYAIDIPGVKVLG